MGRGKEDYLLTKNLTPGESVYGEKRISVESSAQPTALANGANGDAPATKTEYRVWNPFRSKLAAGILGGLDDIFIRPGAKVLYLGAASGTSVSHVADIVGPQGTVFAVEFSHRSGRDLINMATHRTNVIPIIEDARHPLRYRMLVSMVDVIFADVAQPDQARIVGLNAHLYLKVGGGVVVSVKANCIDSTAAPEAVFAREVQKMKEERIKPIEQLTLEPFERGEYSYSSLFVICNGFRGLSGADYIFPQITVLSWDAMFVRLRRRICYSIFIVWLITIPCRKCASCKRRLCCQLRIIICYG